MAQQPDSDRRRCAVDVARGQDVPHTREEPAEQQPAHHGRADPDREPAIEQRQPMQDSLVEIGVGPSGAAAGLDHLQPLRVVVSDGVDLHGRRPGH